MVELNQQRPEIPFESHTGPMTPPASMSAGRGVSSTALSDAPVEDLVIAIDAVDQLRREQQEIERELNSEEQERLLIERLRQRYEARGQRVTDQMLAEAVEALRHDRYRYEPTPSSFQRTLAGWYVDRWKWFGRLAIAATLAGAIGLSYFGLMVNPQRQQAAATGRELTQVTQSLEAADGALAPQVRELTQAARQALESSNLSVAQARVADLQLLQQFQQLKNSVNSTAKVADARTEAERLVVAGTEALKVGKTDVAQQRLAELETLQQQLNLTYTLRIVTKGKTGVWHVPRVNEQARNYYIVVEPIGTNGKPVQVSVTSEEDGSTRMESRFGLRVDELTYQQVEQDKRDNGIIENLTFGTKAAGYLEPEYQMPTLGGKIHVTP
jgi:Family of unknown function (DUF6384)